MNWLCWHVGASTDPKLKLVARKTGASLSQVVHAWSYHLERAAQGTPRGRFGTIDPEEAELDTEIPRPMWMAITIGFEERALTRDGFIVNFDKRNYGNSTLRVRAFRERQRQLALSCGNDETLHVTAERSCNTTGQDRHNKQEIDHPAATDIHSVAAEAAAPPTDKIPPEVKSNGRRKRGTRIAPDWQPTAEDIAFAAEHGIVNGQVARFADEFRDYWTAASGKGAVKLDWSATWRNRVRQIEQWNATRGTRAGGGQSKSGSLVAAMRSAMRGKTE